MPLASVDTGNHTTASSLMPTYKEPSSAVQPTYSIHSPKLAHPQQLSGGQSLRRHLLTAQVSASTLELTPTSRNWFVPQGVCTKAQNDLK